MVQVLLDVEEGVEEDVGELAPLQVAQGDPSWGRRGGTYIIDRKQQLSPDWMGLQHGVSGSHSAPSRNPPWLLAHAIH